MAGTSLLHNIGTNLAPVCHTLCFKILAQVSSKSTMLALVCYTPCFKILTPVWHTLCFTILEGKAPKVAIGMPAAQENGTDRIHGQFQIKSLAHEWYTSNGTGGAIAHDRWQICTSLAYNYKWSRSISQEEQVLLTPMLPMHTNASPKEMDIFSPFRCSDVQ